MKNIICILLLMILTLQFKALQSQSPTCTNYVFQASNLANKTSIIPSFKSCVDLPVLDSYLHWTYTPSTSTLRIAYRHTGLGPAKSKWVAWAINPVGMGMIGAQCLVAYQDPKDGSMVVYTSAISSYRTHLAKGDLSFKVSELSALSLSDEIIIFATLQVPKNATTLNQVWQDGLLSSDGTLRMHSTSGPNVRSMASLNLLSGVAETTVTASGSSLKNVHGVLNAVSWGILMPVGVMIARYMRVFPSADPAWFYLHVGCQLSAFLLGVAGWATGMKLGSQSKGANNSLHRNIGITIFALATLQMFALFMRPEKDHKYRTYWNIYHRSVGYTIIILSIVNIMQGFKILDPVDIWRTAYIGFIVALAVIAAILEAFTWFTVFQRKNAQVTDDGDKLRIRAPV